MVSHLALMMLCLNPGMTPVIDLETHQVFQSESFAVSDDGMIAIGDVNEKQLLIFNNQGKLLAKAGSEGQGPGEFQRLSQVASAPGKKSFLVLDRRNGRISEWDYNGKLVKETPLPRGIYLANFIDAQQMVASFDSVGRRGKPSLMKVNLDSKKTSQLWSMKMEGESEVQRISVGGTRFMYVAPWSQGLYFAANKDVTTFFFGRTNKVTVMDQNDKKKTSSFTVEIPEAKIGDDQVKAEIDSQPQHRRSAIRQNIKKADTWPLIQNMLLDDQRQIWVFGATGSVGGSHPYRVYSYQGKLLKEGSISSIPQAIRDGYSWHLINTDSQNGIYKFKL